MCVCAPCVHLCQQRPAVGTGTPGTETVVGFKPPGGYWESDLGFVQEQVPVPSQPPFHSFRGLFPSWICGHTCMYSCTWMFMPVEAWNWHQMSSRFLPILFILFNMIFKIVSLGISYYVPQFNSSASPSISSLQPYSTPTKENLKSQTKAKQVHSKEKPLHSSIFSSSPTPLRFSWWHWDLQSVTQ